MALKSTIRDLEPRGRRVLVRVDFNVPLADAQVSDDTRIRAALPTIQALRNAGARVILCSHLGRPKGRVVAELSLGPVADRLAELLGAPVAFARDCVGQAAEDAVAALGDGDVVVLENLRFHGEETANDADFAARLAGLAEIYVNDAFGAAHRAHASTAGVTHHLKPAVAGLLMERELLYLSGVLETPESPFVVLLGGAKISGKIEVLTQLLQRADAILVGGGMAFTFLRAQGQSVGGSLVEEDRIETARKVLAAAEESKCRLVLPTDFIVADQFANDAKTWEVDSEHIPDGWLGLDIGPDSVRLFSGEIAAARTIVWNGPMGVFEMENFRQGTMSLAQAVAKASDGGATTVVGGGDSVAAVNLAGIGPRLSHVSTGGGASLELLEGKQLPGVASLDDA